MTSPKRIVDDATDDAADDEDSALEELVAGVVMALIFLVGFGLLALGVSWFWIVFPVGFAGVLPAALALVRIYESRRGGGADESLTTETEDALETLRRRYATGELSEEEFEAKVERLLETETVADARESTAARRREGEAGDAEREAAFDRD
ncbi:SHOCT domain-containing protein [Haloferax sp. AB510]|uniref:SHOCT domain-containing protein n=1 Tax=Haloferax sp. AB510 TaxID=2934172 RepID=UPI00209C1EED|nr:SHOCT domain-containing protein [Haloferax sp. AB510]MCO8266425.1 SHOCT domain-containing protein [Haloferax sp. AB510]